MNYNTVLVFLFLLIIFIIVIRILIDPIKIFLKLLFSCILGAIGIFLFNLIGGFAGIHIGLNIITIVLSGALGIPGIALILILQILFKI